MSRKENIYYIDNIKFILIFLVVFGHLIERYLDNNDSLRGMYMFIYSFHMPLFVFVSGFLSKNLNKSNKIFLKQLIIPYIVLNVIWYTLAYIYTKQSYLPLIYPGWTLWFLLSLFFWKVSLKHLIKIKYILPISFLLGLLVGLVPNGDILSFSRTIVYLPFFLLGYYTKYDDIDRLNKNSNIWLGILGISLFIALFLFISENNTIDYRFLYGSYSYYELGLNIFEGILYRIALYIISIVLSILIIILIPNKKTFYTHIGKSTMCIYVFHVYIVLLIFYFIPEWNKNTLTKWIVLVSPIFVTYILSTELFQKIYNNMFKLIYKLIR